MTPNEFTATLAVATQGQLETLDQAHWRYMSLIGIVSDALPADVVEADQKAYPQLIKRDGGLAVFNDADCTVFMVAITGLSPEFCEAWRDKDFYDLHGETAAEMAASQKMAGSPQQFTISQPLCAAYCKLLQQDFTAEYLLKQFTEENAKADFSDFDAKLSRFHEGLANNRLELAGTEEDVSGWLLCYIEAYIDPDEPGVAFHDWDALSATEQQEVIADAARLSPILRSV